MFTLFAGVTLATTALAGIPASGPDHITLTTEEVNMKKPHKGAWSDLIVDAARVPKKWRPFAACVLDRESGGTLDRVQSGSGAQNPRSSASGRWQFLNTSWNEPLGYMIADRLKDRGVPKSVAKDIRIELQAKPIHKWHGLWQDVAFVSVVTEPGGWRHWNGGGACNSRRP